MTHVDLKSLLLKLNGLSATALQNAAGLCVSRTNYEVSVEHFLLKCLESPRSDIPLILGPLRNKSRPPSPAALNSLPWRTHARATLASRSSHRF